MVVKHLKNNPCGCTGTSNCHLALELDMKMIGTYPHELPMFIAAVNGGPRNANYLTMEDWVKVYDGYLGTALTDSFGSEVFFNNFSKKHACLFDGVRHDSGDPIAFIDMAINRYKELGIDPMTKSIVFSDSLNFEKCVKIKNACEGRIKCMFGIGTNLTCDTGHASCNIVMKATMLRSPNSCRKWPTCGPLTALSYVSRSRNILQSGTASPPSTKARSRD